MRTDLPPELDPVRERARRALGPVLPAGKRTKAAPDFLFDGKRTQGKRDLPSAPLIYFMLVDLLGFEDLGKFEKLAWSIPIDFEGQAFLVEHRKFGVGLFAHDPVAEKAATEKIIEHLHKVVRATRPFFDWLAQKAVKESAVNVVSNSGTLFDRSEFFLKSYREKLEAAHDRKDERIVTMGGSGGRTWETTRFPAFSLHRQARWLGLVAIEAFFSWTEHVFIHIAILTGAVSSASDMADLAATEWAGKYKRALSLTDPVSKDFYDKLVTIRQEVRNLVAHGSFGKQGEAFQFHSSAGVVPVLLPHRPGSRKFSLGDNLEFDVETPVQIVEAYIQHLWSGSRAPAEIYIQHYQLPLVLSWSIDGTYADTMRSTEEMEDFAHHLGDRFDRAANMDW